MISLVILTFCSYHIRTVTSSSDKFTHPLIQSFSSHSLHISFTYLSHLHHFATRSLLLRGHVSEHSMTTRSRGGGGGATHAADWGIRLYMRRCDQRSQTILFTDCRTEMILVLICRTTAGHWLIVMSGIMQAMWAGAESALISFYCF